MKRQFTFLALIAAIAVGCAPKNNSSAPVKISPLPSGYSIDNLTDCTVPARFTVDDFNWRGSNLTFTLYEEAFYDAAEVSRMKKGDTLMFNDRTIIVSSIVKDGDYLTVNGGVEEGGAYLQAHEGGTWRGATFDDHSIYKEVGEVEVMLDDDFTIVDCGIEPEDPIVTVTLPKPYIDTLESSKTEFIPLNTRIRIEDGRIKEIVRRWIP